MDQEKIGLFIASCRKTKGLTQKQLAEKLNVSDKSVSKWERGINLPDASLYIPLCDILEINLNEFFLGRYDDDNHHNDTLSVEQLEKEYKKKIRIKRWAFVLLFLSIFITPAIVFVWSWDLSWLRLEPRLAKFSNLWYLSLLYFVAYILVYKSSKKGYYLMWIIFALLSTGIIANWGYDFNIICGRIDFFTNVILTLFGVYKQALKINIPDI